MGRSDTLARRQSLTYLRTSRGILRPRGRTPRRTARPRNSGPAGETPRANGDLSVQSVGAVLFVIPMDPAQILALLERRDVHVERERGGPQVWHIENSRTGTTVRHESLATAVAAFVALNSPLYDPARRPE